MITAKQQDRFRRICKQLNALMVEIQETEPDAGYYLACSTLNLMQGASHTGSTGTPHHENVVASMHIVGADGGDW